MLIGGSGLDPALLSTLYQAFGMGAPPSQLSTSIDLSEMRSPNVDVSSGWWRPRTDVLEEGNHLRVEFELPGVMPEEISLTATEGTIVLRSTKSMSNKEQKGTYFQRERHFGNFYRRVILPDYVDAAKHDAILDNGVLKVIFQMKSANEAGTQRTPIVFTPHKR